MLRRSLGLWVVSLFLNFLNTVLVLLFFYHGTSIWVYLFAQPCFGLLIVFRKHFGGCLVRQRVIKSPWLHLRPYRVTSNRSWLPQWSKNCILFYYQMIVISCHLNDLGRDRDGMELQCSSSPWLLCGNGFHPLTMASWDVFFTTTSVRHIGRCLPGFVSYYELLGNLLRQGNGTEASTCP